MRTPPWPTDATNDCISSSLSSQVHLFLESCRQAMGSKQTKPVEPDIKVRPQPPDETDERRSAGRFSVSSSVDIVPQLEDNDNIRGSSVRSSMAMKDGPAAYWLPDNKSDECQLCEATFSFFRRRHHCRSCGGLFCTSCSSRKDVVPHRGYYTKPVRVCDLCFTKAAANAPSATQPRRSFAAGSRASASDLDSRASDDVSRPSRSRSAPVTPRGGQRSEGLSWKDPLFQSKNQPDDAAAARTTENPSKQKDAANVPHINATCPVSRGRSMPVDLVRCMLHFAACEQRKRTALGLKLVPSSIWRSVMDYLPPLHVIDWRRTEAGLERAGLVSAASVCRATGDFSLCVSEFGQCLNFLLTPPVETGVSTAVLVVHTVSWKPEVHSGTATGRPAALKPELLQLFVDRLERSMVMALVHESAFGGARRASPMPSPRQGTRAQTSDPSSVVGSPMALGTSRAPSVGINFHAELLLPGVGAEPDVPLTVEGYLTDGDKTGTLLRVQHLVRLTFDGQSRAVVFTVSRLTAPQLPRFAQTPTATPQNSSRRIHGSEDVGANFSANANNVTVSSQTPRGAAGRWFPMIGVAGALLRDSRLHSETTVDVVF